MAGLLVAGCSSDAGKSLITAGLCRAWARQGIKVAPFKAQNMSNNSMICPDGSEIGRAQYLQALAAGVEPSSVMNPVLLKPATDRRAFIVLRGQPGGTLEAGEYATGRTRLAAAAFDAYRELEGNYDLIVAEGAGSPAEINLRAGDYVNFGLAAQFGLPTLLVGDIDRGGLLASLYGHWALLDGADRSLLAGYLINKFRGDQSVLEPGLERDSRPGQGALLRGAARGWSTCGSTARTRWTSATGARAFPDAPAPCGSPSSGCPGSRTPPTWTRSPPNPGSTCS